MSVSQSCLRSFLCNPYISFQFLNLLFTCSKVKFKRFGKEVEFKRYLRGVGDAGTRLLFKFRSGTHGLNEELGRHRCSEGKSECVLCGAECESVARVLWECSAYSNIRVIFVEKLRELLGDRYVYFDKLNSIEKTAYEVSSGNTTLIISEGICCRCLGCA